MYRRFLRRLPVAFVGGLLIWLLLRPVLDVGVSWFAQTLVRAFEVPRVTRLVPADHRADVVRADFRSDSQIPSIPLTPVHFNTIVLLALYLGVPHIVSRRQLERLFMGWTILLFLQTLNLVAHVEFMYATALGPWSTANYSSFARNVWGYVRYFTDLPGLLGAPFLIWIGLNWDVFVEIVRLSPGPETGRRDRAGSPSSRGARRRKLK